MKLKELEALAQAAAELDFHDGDIMYDFEEAHPPDRMLRIYALLKDMDVILANLVDGNGDAPWLKRLSQKLLAKLEGDL